jgi:hypothetical protein
MSFDLAKSNLSVKAEKGYEFELIVPGTYDAPTGAFVTVRGAESKAVRDYSRRKFNEFQARQKIDKKRGKDSDDFSLDEAEELAVESAIVRIIGWKGIQEEGKEVVFSKENAERILTEHSWIREVVMEASNELTNFRQN